MTIQILADRGGGDFGDGFANGAQKEKDMGI